MDICCIPARKATRHHGSLHRLVRVRAETLPWVTGPTGERGTIAQCENRQFLQQSSSLGSYTVPPSCQTGNHTLFWTVGNVEPRSDHYLESEHRHTHRAIEALWFHIKPYLFCFFHCIPPFPIPPLPLLGCPRSKRPEAELIEFRPESMSGRFADPTEHLNVTSSVVRHVRCGLEAHTHAANGARK